MGHYLSEMLHPEPAYLGKELQSKDERIHIITSKKKWGVYKSGKYRSIKNFKHRDLAFHYAMTHFKKRIIVHNTDGSVDFIKDNF